MSTINFITQVEKILSSLKNGARIAVAVSGGADSMALALLANEWLKKNKKNIELHALTVDHKLRKEAAGEAKKVGRWLKKKKIKHHILTNRDKKIPHSNIQEYARKTRYSLMRNWCRENDVKYLLVAHHAEDQAETFLLRLERGSGVDGLSAMQPASKYQGVTLLRPLLETRKPRLKEYLKEANQEWIEDPTNQNKAYKRNTIRAALEKTTDEDLLIKRLNNTAKAMSRVKEALDHYVSAHLAESTKKSKDGSVIFNHEILKSVPEEIGLKMLVKILCAVGGKEKKTRISKLKNLYNRLLENQNFKGCTLWKCQISPHKQGGILFTREHKL